MKSIATMLASLLFAAVSAGCATVGLDGNGGGGFGAQQPDIMEQLAKDSQGGDA